MAEPTDDNTTDPTIADQLIAAAQAADIDPIELDELVHDLVSRKASRINNGGLDSQIRYITDQLGDDQARRQLAALGIPTDS